MRNIFVSQITDKISPFVDKYLDEKFPRGLKEMPNNYEIARLASDINARLLSNYPDLEPILEPDIGGRGMRVSYFGCRDLLAGVIAGGLLVRCNRGFCGFKGGYEQQQRCNCPKCRKKRSYS